jgi:glycosyltransferase involved in cell wall biosynthesis
LKKAYIYPISARDKHLGQYNPYLDDFMDAMGKYLVFINRNDPSNSGILNITKYFFKIDFIFLNWIENIPDRKGGMLQTYFLLALLSAAKWFGIRIVWTMHNKLSHSPTKMKVKEKIFKSLLKHSDLILSHSSAGIDFGKELMPGSESKIIYLPHPLKDRRSPHEPEKEFDILIWGTIAPYKGIHDFLEFLYKKQIETKYRIHIVGKISDANYSTLMESYANNNIIIENRFIEDEILAQLIGKSKIILFTYSKSSILSSGVLMDSLGYGGRIAGPDVGAFKDLEREGIVETYHHFDELIAKLDSILSLKYKNTPSDQLNRFLADNFWNKFAGRFAKKLKLQ